MFDTGQPFSSLASCGKRPDTDTTTAPTRHLESNRRADPANHRLECPVHVLAQGATGRSCVATEGRGDPGHRPSPSPGTPASPAARVDESSPSRLIEAPHRTPNSVLT